MKASIRTVLVLSFAAAALGGCCKSFNVASSPSLSVSATSSPFPQVTATSTAFVQETVSPSPTATPTLSVQVTIIPSPTATPTAFVQVTVSPSPTATPTASVQETAISYPTITPTPLATADDLVFSSPDLVTPGSMRLCTVHPDGTGLRVLVDRTDLKCFHPSWSPDKSQIVFEGYGSGPSQLYTINADGSGLAAIPNTLQAGAPAWSPDGTDIVFVSGALSPAELCSIHPDGTGLVQLTHEANGVSQEDFACSPDGSRIAYNTPDGTRIMDSNGGNVADFPVTMSQMDWSPDGKSFVFYAYLGQSGTNNIFQVFRVNADGTGLVQLTNTDSHVGACWSKDGSHIVVVDTWATTPPNMYLMNPDGSGSTPIPGAYIYYCYQPCWH